MDNLSGKIIERCAEIESLARQLCGDEVRADKLKAVAISAWRLLQKPYNRPSSLTVLCSLDDNALEGEDWDNLRAALIKAGYSL